MNTTGRVFLSVMLVVMMIVLLGIAMALNVVSWGGALTILVLLLIPSICFMLLGGEK